MTEHNWILYSKKSYNDIYNSYLCSICKTMKYYGTVHNTYFYSTNYNISGLKEEPSCNEVVMKNILL